MVRIFLLPNSTFFPQCILFSLPLISRPPLDLLQAQTRMSVQESKVATENDLEKASIYLVLNTSALRNGQREGISLFCSVNAVQILPKKKHPIKLNLTPRKLHRPKRQRH